MDTIILYSHELEAGYQKNLGPYVIASNLRLNGFSCQVLDFNYIVTKTKNEITKTSSIQHAYIQNLVKPFLSKDTMWLGLSTTFMQKDLYFSNKENVNEFCKWVRSISPNCKFLIGGARVHDFIHPGWYQFRGHFDDEIIEFTKWCRNPKLGTWIDPLNKNITGNSNKTFCNRMHHWHYSDVISTNEALPIEISRGCIFRCAFCRYNLNGKSKMDYVKDPGILREEFEENYSKYNTIHYTFADDTFNESVYKLNYLNDGCFKHLKHPIKFSCFLRLDLLMSHPEMVELLPAMGLAHANFGIETLDPRNAKLIGKGKDPMKQIEFLRYLKQKWPGITLNSSFIFGLPYDSLDYLDMFYNTIYSNDSPLDQAILFGLKIFTPKETKLRGVFVSPFDLDSAKYGYTFKGDVWYNSTSGLNGNQCEKLAKDLMLRVEREAIQRNSGFGFNRILNINVPIDELYKLTSRELGQQYDIIGLTRKRHAEYFQHILNMEPGRGIEPQL